MKEKVTNKIEKNVAAILIMLIIILLSSCGPVQYASCGGVDGGRTSVQR
tara:strand:+ start:868 stop:1014 length:147 start_codon:yes stop_codon:yes gene_type:complete